MARRAEKPKKLLAASRKTSKHTRRAFLNAEDQLFHAQDREGRRAKYEPLAGRP